ncbi:MAG: amidohydrolase [Porphyromonas sp.]|nr:amidohydrolase [Porphyromonas sp.]
MILIKNAFDGNRQIDLLIEGNRIARIAEHIEPNADWQVIDATGKAIIPGLINTHTHAAMTLLRGYGDDLPLMTWLQDYIWPIEDKMTEEDVYIGAKLAMLEMIKTGTTCYLDMYMHPLMGAKAAEEMGLRAMISYTLFDQGNPERARLDRERSAKYLEQFRSDFSDRILFNLGPHAIYTVSGEQLQFCHDFCRQHGLKIHLHLSETEGEVEECIRLHGLRPVKYLEQLGILSEHLILAHVIWVDDEEMDLLAKYNVSVVHNPASNMKLASGYAFKYEEMKRRGIRIGLGTDGCSSSNNLDMFTAMRLASFLGKVWRFDSTAVKADDIFASATSIGADILGIDAGVLAEGKLADLCLIDLDRPEMVPVHNLTSNLVYSASGAFVDTVICDGRILMQGGYVEGEEEIIRQAREVAARLVPKT